MNKGQDMVLSSASLLCFVFVFFFCRGGGVEMVVKVIPLRLTNKKNKLTKKDCTT